MTTPYDLIRRNGSWYVPTTHRGMGEHPANLSEQILWNLLQTARNELATSRSQLERVLSFRSEPERGVHAASASASQTLFAS